MGTAAVGKGRGGVVRSRAEKTRARILRGLGGSLWLPLLDLDLGSSLRIQVRARDVSIALSPPKDVSILNVFVGEVIEVGDDDGPQVDILLNIGTPLWARITKRSQRELGITPGRTVYAMIKAMAVDNSRQ